MTPLKSVCVYCGSAFGANPKHRATAQRFGELLGRNGIDLVYGGGRVGLMGAIADAALKNGSKVIGVIPEHLQSKEVGHHGISELRIVPNMHERKELMFRLSDAFVILPGGFGTLDEMFEAVTLIQTKKVKPFPVILVGDDDYWDGLLHWISTTLVKRGKVREDEVKIIQRARNPQDVLKILRKRARTKSPRDKSGIDRAGKEIP
jgi:uncharacterized protein (TIGR00730 family)